MAPAPPPAAPATSLRRNRLPPTAAAAISLAEVEKRHILAALEKTKQNRTHAARLLGISIRTLRNKLNEYGVKSREPETLVEGEA